MTEPGYYLGAAISGVLSKAGTGSLQMIVTFSITQRAENSEWVELGQPIERSMFLSLTDKAKQYTADKLAMLGFDGNCETPGFATGGHRLTCSHEKYQGKDRERWELTDYSGGEPTQADADAIRQTNAWWKAVSARSPAGAPGKPPTGDDIPFRAPEEAKP